MRPPRRGGPRNTEISEASAFAPTAPEKRILPLIRGIRMSGCTLSVPRRTGATSNAPCHLPSFDQRSDPQPLERLSALWRHQLKSQRRPFISQIMDAGYRAMHEAVLQNRTPNILAVHYDPTKWAVRSLILIPQFVFSLSCIIKRNPLSPSRSGAGTRLATSPWQTFRLMREFP